MSDDEKPKGLDPNTIEMTIRRVVCDVHGEPFRVKWPAGYPITMMRLFEQVAGPKAPPERVEALWRDARIALGLAADAEVPAKAGMEAALDRKALCCRVTATNMLHVYTDSGIGVRDRCNACGKRGLGTEYKTMQGVIPHLCFRCVCEQIERRAKFS